MAAVGESSTVKVTFRHGDIMRTCLATRYQRLHVSGVPLEAGREVEISWYYTYDKTSKHPDWKVNKGSRAVAKVLPGGHLEYILVFGPVVQKFPEHVCNMVLTRPPPLPPVPAPPSLADDVAGRGAPAPVVAHSPPFVLPLLSYIISSVKSDFQVQGRVKFTALWGETVFGEAQTMFKEIDSKRGNEFISLSAVKTVLINYWQEKFKHLHRIEDRRTKSLGKKIAKDDACNDDHEEEELVAIPGITDEQLMRIIAIGTDTGDSIEDVPKMICHRAFCGLSPTEGVGIWRVFQNALELVGRSTFIRQLWNNGQLLILNATETVEIHTDKFAELGQNFVYFFRIPRSVVHEAALVLEMFEVVYTNNSTVLKPVRPTPYITAPQLDEANGNPFIAFSKLETVHHDKIAAITHRGLLQPPQIRVKPFTEDLYKSDSVEFRSNVTSAPCSDLNWWNCGRFK